MHYIIKKKNDDKLIHSDEYLNEEFDDELYHYKYIDKYKSKSGKWVYVYNKSGAGRRRKDNSKNESSYSPSYSLGKNVDSSIADYYKQYLESGGLNGKVWDNKTQTSVEKHYTNDDIESVSISKEYVGYGSKTDDNYYNYRVDIRTKDGHDFRTKNTARAVQDAIAEQKRIDSELARLKKASSSSKQKAGKSFIEKFFGTK